MTSSRNLASLAYGPTLGRTGAGGFGFGVNVVRAGAGAPADFSGATRVLADDDAAPFLAGAVLAPAFAAFFAGAAVAAFLPAGDAFLAAGPVFFAPAAAPLDVLGPAFLAGEADFFVGAGCFLAAAVARVGARFLVAAAFVAAAGRDEGAFFAAAPLLAGFIVCPPSRPRIAAGPLTPTAPRERVTIADPMHRGNTGWWRHPP